ncbi:MAG TPA: efflux RND transporter periplasmic adaptor subunit [Gemmatimonadota bacterium]|nr:efflux RND transporter periplasmic adaptor subunit [Gemmatimonadota bacterium]
MKRHIRTRGEAPVRRSARGGLLRSGLPAVAAAAALVAGACGGGGTDGGGARQLPVETAIARADTVSVELSSVGSLQAQTSAQVASQAAGQVAAIEAREGSRVEHGEVLMRLDARKLQAQLQAAEAAVERARAQAENLERQLERNRELRQKGAISRQAFDDLQSSYDAARAQLHQAEADAALARRQRLDANIRAPFAGRLGERTFDVGDYVREGDPLFTVTDDDTLEVRFEVPESYSDRLEPGSPMQVRTPVVPGRWFDGAVSFVSPTVDPVNRTVTLKAQVPNPDGRLRAGSSADVRLVLERRPGAVVLPEAVLVPRQGRTLVFLVSGGKAVRREVTVGVRTAGRVEIRSGVTAGDTVVTAGQQRLQDAAPVAIQGRAAGGSPIAADTAAGTDTAASAGTGATSPDTGAARADTAAPDPPGTPPGDGG